MISIPIFCVSLLHISSIVKRCILRFGDHFIIRTFGNLENFKKERIINERLHVRIAYNFVIYILWRGAIAYYFLAGLPEPRKWIICQ